MKIHVKDAVVKIPVKTVRKSIGIPFVNAFYVFAKLWMINDSRSMIQNQQFQIIKNI